MPGLRSITLPGSGSLTIVSSTWERREASGPQPEGQPVRLLREGFRVTDGGLQRPRATGLLQHALLLRVPGPSRHLPRVLLPARLQVLRGVRDGTRHPPRPDLRHVLLVLPLPEADRGDVLRAPLQPRHVAAVERLQELRLLLGLRRLHRLLLQPPAVQPGGRPADEGRVRARRRLPGRQLLLPPPAAGPPEPPRRRVPDPPRLPVRRRHVRQLHHRDLPVGRVQRRHADRGNCRGGIGSQYVFLVVAAAIMTNWTLGKHRRLKKVKLAIQHMRKIVKRKASFDIMDLDTIQVAKRCFVPALFGHATEDDFILPHHSDKIYESYIGDKNIIKFDGDHNSPRPQFYFDSITIFFHNVLNPPEVADDHYFLTPRGSLGQGHWDTEQDIEYRFSQSPTAHATTTEDAIAQLRSRRLMSRMEVPSGAMTEGRADRTEGLDSDLGPSSSVSTATPPNGRNGRLLTPTSDDGEYVEYSFDSLSDMPYTVEDEDRMLMQAILESLKDYEQSNTKNVQSTASDAASKENDTVKDCNGVAAAALEQDASSVSFDAPGKHTNVCNSGEKVSEGQTTDCDSVKSTASVSASGSSEPLASTQMTNGKPASAESQKVTQNANGEDRTRATLVVQKSRTGGLIDGLTQKWGCFFKNND